MSFKLDTRQFARAVDFVVRETGKDFVDVVNRAALTAVIGGRGVKGAMKRTPRAEKAKIVAVDVKQIAAFVLKRARAKGVKLGGRALAKEVRKEYRRRVSSIAYAAGPGWHNAAVALGGKGVKVQAGFIKSQARHGSGSKARGGKLVAVIVNTAPAIEKIGVEALQDALADVSQDMISHVQKTVQRSFKKVKG
jgi:hypothetical protein